MLEVFRSIKMCSEPESLRDDHAALNPNRVRSNEDGLFKTLRAKRGAEDLPRHVHTIVERVMSLGDRNRAFCRPWERLLVPAQASPRFK